MIFLVIQVGKRHISTIVEAGKSQMPTLLQIQVAGLVRVFSFFRAPNLHYLILGVLFAKHYLGYCSFISFCLIWLNKPASDENVVNETKH